MKPVIKKLVAISLCCAVLCAVLSSCNSAKRIPKVTKNRLEYTCSSKKLNDADLSNYTKFVKGDFIDLDFGKEVMFDTVSLYEKGDNCNEFRLYIDRNGEWELVYQQDRILAHHLCFLGEVTTQKLRLEITDCAKEVQLQEVSVYMAEKTDREVKVSQYLRLDAADFEELMDDEGFSGYYDVVTDPIIFGEIYMDSNAKICYNTSEEFFAKQLAAFRKIIGDRNVRIWCCIFFDQNNEDGSRNLDKTKDFVNENIDKISANVKAFVEKYDLYGIDYDWEYPEKTAQWKAYDKIVERTAEVTKVSVAVPPWSIRFSKSAREKIENLNVMAYDLFDERGDHSNAYIAGYEAINKVKGFGYEDDQILLGIPTYGRTTDKSGDAWPTIRDDGKDFGKWGKMIKDYPYTDSATNEKKTCDAYLNSYAEARDKTALAIDENIGGIMIFRAFCDAPYTEEYSLHRAIGEAIAERTEK